MTEATPPSLDRADGGVIYYLAVAGDVAGTWAQWRAGIGDQGSASVTYSGQFFDVCTALGYRGVVNFPAATPKTVGDAAIKVKSRPLAGQYKGLQHHLTRLKTSLAILRDILKERPRYAVLMDGVCYWFMLAPARLAGVKMIVSVHTVFWPPFARVSRVRRLVLACEGWFLRHHCAGLIAISRQIVTQANEIAGIALKSSVFLPLYDRTDFDRLADPVVPGSSVHLLYTGRIEAIKGVFDLLQMVITLQQSLSGRVTLAILGDGSDHAALVRQIAALNLGDVVTAPGACARDRVIAELERAQIVLVPTRSDFPEGYVKSAVEAILARRPLITSAVCPSLDDLRGAVEEARPDDVQSYVDAVLRLCSDPALYHERVRAAGVIREKYFDEAASWGANLRATIED